MKPEDDEPRGRVDAVSLLYIFGGIPMIVLFLLAIFSDVLSDAFDSWVVPLLGFFLLPWTTLTYAAFWDWGAGRHVTGFEWFFVGLAFVIDLGVASARYAGRRAMRKESPW